MHCYPPVEPYKQHILPVTPPHKIYIEECGNPQGMPVVFLHGGPGAGCEPGHRQFFDPQKYRIILFDQRGCGRSTPHAELSANTTWDLVDDMEQIREFLQIDQWLVFGGSWGSTLALAYAQSHPQHVSAMILRGIFLARDEDVQWFYQQGCSRLFADYWEDFIAPVPVDERQDMVAAYYRLLTSADESVRLRAAKAWSVWEGRTANLKTNPHVLAHFSDPHTALSIARIECHYFQHHSFLQERPLLDNMHKIAHIPGYIVHGRYDVICPVDQALALHQCWPGSELNIMPGSGHSAMEPEIQQMLVSITDRCATELRP